MATYVNVHSGVAVPQRNLTEHQIGRANSRWVPVTPDMLKLPFDVLRKLAWHIRRGTGYKLKV